MRLYPGRKVKVSRSAAVFPGSVAHDGTVGFSVVEARVERSIRGGVGTTVDLDGRSWRVADVNTNEKWFTLEPVA